MQIFELHFNPKLKEEQIFDSFVYEPENIYERKLGSLYLIGELQNTLPQNLKFLDNLAGVIKKKYYSFLLKPAEKAFSETLKKVNGYLGEEVKKDNVNWLGNLNFAVISLKDLNLNLTKTGNLKILLIRAGQIIDIGKNLDLQEIEPYPLKIFISVVTGKLAQDDIILVLTKEVFNFFYRQNILSKITQTKNLDSKKLKEILPLSLFTKDEGSKISGICFLCLIKTELKTVRRPREIYFRRKEKFSFSQIFSPLLKLTKLYDVFKHSIKFLSPIKYYKRTSKSRTFLKVRDKSTKRRLKYNFVIPKIKNLIKIPLPILGKFQFQPRVKIKLILILILIFLLFLGFLIF